MVISRLLGPAAVVVIEERDLAACGVAGVHCDEIWWYMSSL